MLGRLDLEPTLQVRAVVDPNIKSKPYEMPVCVMLPQLPNVAKLHVRGRLVVVQQPLVFTLDQRLFAKPLLAHYPRRHHHMRVKIPDITFALRLVNVEIHRGAIAVCQIPRKVAGECQTIGHAHLMRKRYLELARNPRILTNLGALHCIPERRSV